MGHLLRLRESAVRKAPRGGAAAHSECVIGV